MRRQLVAGFFLLSISIAHRATGQVAASSPTELQTAQSQAYSALVTAAQPAYIVLNGTFASTEGSLTQQGNAQLTVRSDGTFLINLSRAVGPIAETRTVADGLATCTWTDQKSVVHKSSFLNCLPPAWFFPGLALLTGTSNSSDSAWAPSSYTSGSLGDHLRFQFVAPQEDGTPPEDPLLLKPFDLILAPDTHLPQYALFILHPDNPGVSADIPVRIAYTDYRSISGVMIPFHIRRFVNGSLVLDLAIATASVQ